MQAWLLGPHAGGSWPPPWGDTMAVSMGEGGGGPAASAAVLGPTCGPEGSYQHYRWGVETGAPREKTWRSLPGTSAWRPGSRRQREPWAWPTLGAG